MNALTSCSGYAPMNMLTGCAVAERNHGGDALALHGLQQRVADLVRVDVELGQEERSLTLVGDLLQDRTQRPARPAPGGPEVDDHRTRLRALDDELLEIRVRDLDDVRSGDAHTPSSVREDRRNRRSRSAFTTTLTLDAAMAPAAHMGVRTPTTASGIITALYANAQNRFCAMTR